MRLASAGDTLNVEVLVKDTGPGIPREHLSKIFDRFASFDPGHAESASSAAVQEGVGIGLALAKELVELHKGVILVESEPGCGSTFIVRLPLSPISLDVTGTAEVPHGLDETASRLEEPTARRRTSGFTRGTRWHRAEEGNHPDRGRQPGCTRLLATSPRRRVQRHRAANGRTVWRSLRRRLPI